MAALPPDPPPVALITGCTSGIGLAAAEDLAGKVQRLVLVGRSREKLDQLAARLAGRGAQLEVIVGELGERAAVRGVAEAFLAAHDRLDLLVNNAGVYNQERKLTADGVEETFAVNHLGYFDLTLRLLPALRAAGAARPPARVVNVASDAHKAGTMAWDDLERAGAYAQGWPSYGQSKLANILFTRELARRLGPAPIVTHALHPGFVNTGFARNNGWLGNFIMNISRPFQRSPADAAKTISYLAFDPLPAQSSGGYWYKERPSRPTAAAQDPAAAARLWALSLERCGFASDPLPA